MERRVCADRKRKRRSEMKNETKAQEIQARWKEIFEARQEARKNDPEWNQPTEELELELKKE